MKLPRLAIVGMIFCAIALCLAAPGCGSSDLMVVHRSSKSIISLRGTVLGADGSKWSGGGQLCYHVTALGMANKDGCEIFDTTKTPGSFLIEKDITEMVSSPPVYFEQKLSLNISGTTVPGTITSTGVEEKSLTLNTASVSLAQVVVEATFRVPAGLASQPVLAQIPADLTRAAFASLEGRSQAGLGSSVADQDEAKQYASALVCSSNANQSQATSQPL